MCIYIRSISHSVFFIFRSGYCSSECTGAVFPTFRQHRTTQGEDKKAVLLFSGQAQLRTRARVFEMTSLFSSVVVLYYFLLTFTCSRAAIHTELSHLPRAEYDYVVVGGENISVYLGLTMIFDVVCRRHGR